MKHLEESKNLNKNFKFSNFITKNIKKSQGEIILSLVFIVVAFLIISIYITFNNNMLYLNYINNQKIMAINNLYNDMSLLKSCYGYPIMYQQNRCFSDPNIEIRVLNTSCQSKIILKGKETNNYINMIVPIYSKKDKICIGEIRYYYNINK